MKKLITVFSALLIGLNVLAQSPEYFKYQAVVRDASGGVLLNQSVGLQIEILIGSSAGTTVYEEIHNPTTNNFGLINLNIGEGTVQSGIFETIDWGNDSYFVRVSIDISGGSSYTEMGTSQLLSVPYSLHSKTTENYNETDPIFTAHDAYGITGTNITDWNTAYGWGDHSIEGYLTSYTETDPFFNGSPAGGILNNDITNWNSAYGWGDHSTEGYLTSELWSLNGSNVYYNSGNIGIGTSSPGQMLDVAGNIRLSGGDRIIESSNGYLEIKPNDATYGLLLRDYTGSSSIWSSFKTVNATNDYLHITMNTTNANEGICISDNGSVGIGTVSPTEKLHIDATSSIGIYCFAHPASGDAIGIFGIANGPATNYAVIGNASGGTANYAGYFFGDVHITGTTTKSASSSKIDHPLDPENKYLCLSSVESPEMMNIFNGNVILNANGEATVTMPDWFEAINMEFRYQLTAIGAPGPNLFIKEEIKNNQFVIAGGEPDMKVSWMLTGIRNDLFAKEHRIEVEKDKPVREKGKYIHPSLYNQPKEKGVGYETNKHPEIKE